MSNEIRENEEDFNLVDIGKRIEVTLNDNQEVVAYGSPDLSLIDISVLIGNSIAIFAEDISNNNGDRSAVAYLEYIRVCQETAIKKYKEKIKEEGKKNASTEI
jgi:hypothetical protein